MCLSQHFSFPLSVPFNHSSIPIHSPTTHTILPVLQISPVTAIPPMIHTHSFTYHPHYIMFLFQYLRFRLSVSFHHCSTPIHSPTTHATYCFSSSTFVFACQYHSTIAPHPFIHLPPTLYNISLPVPLFSPVSIIPPLLHTHSFTYHPLYVSLPVLQFSPVSTIPPTLHTHSFTYHPHYIMFLSQYFRFPLSVPFHQCSILIHSPTTHTI